MRKLFKTIFHMLQDRINAFAEDTAEALENRDKLHLFRNVVLALMVFLGVFGGVSLLLVLLYLGRKVFLPLIGVPLCITILVASYFENRKDTALLNADSEERALLEERAEALYEYVRDGIFLVLRALSDYTPIVRPSSVSAIETNSRFYVRDGVAIFQFNALLSDDVDVPQLKRDIERVLGQKLRTNELPGLPSKLVTINGRTYTPIQILSLADMGSSVNIDVVLTNEKSIHLIEAKRQLHLEKRNSATGDIPYDEEF